jgi:hypothetical protein
VTVIPRRDRPIGHATGAITIAIDTHVQAEQTRRGDDEDGPTSVLVPAG